MPKKVGITIGKFMPLHLGHKHMIDTALDTLDHLIVIVSGSEDDEIPLSERRFDLFAEYFFKDKIYVVKHIDDSPTPKNINKNGTVLDEDYQDYWIRVFRQYKVTHIVSSDMYGKTLAERMGVRWFPVDPKRELYPISGTEIRKNPTKNFHMLTETAKRRYMKTVAIVGPESVGKSTITKRLADEFQGIAIPEYGRSITEVKENLDKEDFDHIFQVQDSMIRRAQKSLRYPLVVSDTEALVTYVYGKIYLNTSLYDELDSVLKNQHIDLYILMAPTVQWVDDGSRVMSNDEERWWFFSQMIELLISNKKNYVIIYKSDDYEERYEMAKSAVQELIG